MDEGCSVGSNLQPLRRQLEHTGPLIFILPGGSDPVSLSCVHIAKCRSSSFRFAAFSVLLINSRLI